MHTLSKQVGKSLLVGSLVLALMFAGARTATAYEAPEAAFSGGVSTMTGSGLTQTWTASGATTLTGIATTAGAKGFTPTLYSPTLTASTQAETVTTAVGTCAVTGTCSGLGTLTVSFAHPVVNPIIHFAGLGDSVGAVLFHVTLTLTTPGLTVTKGNGTNYKVVVSTITAVDDKTSGSCTSFAAPTTDTAVCGSFRLSGTVTSATFAMGAVSTDTSSDGVLTNGEDEFLVLATVDQDYGDAPTSYDSGNAARAVVSDIRLGSTVTADSTATLNATTSPNAGVGATGDTDDGVMLGSLPTVATSYSTTVSLSGASSAGQVCGWVDFNKNGVFDNPSERQCAAVAAGQPSATLTWTGLSGLTAGTTYARFRVGYNDAQTQSPTGASDSGEVEDHAVQLVAIATPTAAPDSPTTLQDVNVTVDPLANDAADALTNLDRRSVRLLDPATSTYGTSVTIANQGTYTVNTTTGIVTFNPLPTFVGSATPITYQVADMFGQTATSTVTPMVTPVVPAPVNDTVTTPYATPTTVDVLANDAPGEPSSPLVPSSVKVLDPADSTYKSSVTIAGQGAYSVNATTGAVTFTPEPLFRGPATPITYRVADDNATTATATLTMTVGAPPSPTAADDSVTTPQGVAVTLSTLLNDAQSTLGAALVPALVMLKDPVTSTFQSSVTVANEGTWTVDPAIGAVTFTPLPTFVGTATAITYRVADTNGATAEAVEHVSVSAVIPTANPDSTTTPYETPVTLPVVGNDVAGDPSIALVPSSVQLRDSGDIAWKSSVTLTGIGAYAVQPDDSVTFTPVQGYTGTSSVPYRIADANGTYAESTVSVTVSNPPAPTAAPDTATTAQGVAVSVEPLTNDSSDPAAPLDPTSVAMLDGGTPVASLTVPGEGTYTVDSATGAVTFTPLPTFHGTATPVQYQVADEAGQLATSTISVEVTAVTPTAAPDSATTPYAHPVTVPLLTNDVEGASTAPLVPGSVQLQDPADSGWKTSVTVPGIGTYVVQPDGSVIFTPQAGYSGTTAALPYRVADTNGTYALSTVTVDVGTPPTASPDTASTPQGLPVIINELDNDTPGTGGSFLWFTVLLEDDLGRWATVVTVPGEGSYVADPWGDVFFIPVPTFHGTATAIGYQVLDSYGNTATSSITVTVTPVVPVATPDTATTPYETGVNVPLLANDTPGNPGIPLVSASVELKDPADNAWKSFVTVANVGTYTVQPDGSVSFVPAQGYTGTTPAPLDPASVKLLDPATSTYKASVTIPGEGTYVVDPTTGDVTFTPLKPFHGTATPVTYEVKDEAGQVTTAAIKVVVTAVTPSATPDSATTPYAHAVIVPVVSDDSPGDPSIPFVQSSLVLLDPSDTTWKTPVTVAGVGTYTANPDGTVRFVPAPGYRGTTAALPYRVADTNGTYAQSTVTITVQAPPYANPDTATTLQGQQASVSPLGNDGPGGTSTLVPGTLLLLDPRDSTYKSTVIIVGEGGYRVNPATHHVDFVPVLAFSGTAASVQYQVTDSDGNAASSTITITVTPVIPVALPDNASTPYAHAVNIPLLSNDQPGNPLAPLVPGSVQLRDPVTGAWGTSVTIPNVGTYVVQPDGSVTFTPAARFTGSAPALPYRVADTNGTLTSSTISVVVGAPPVAAPDAATTLQNQPVTFATLTNDQPGTSATLVPSSVQLVDPSTGLPQPVVVVPNQGTYAVDSTTGEITFIPVPWFSGFASAITYQVSDSNGNTATSWVSVHVTAVVPDVVADSATTPFRTPVTIPVLANDAPGDATAPLVTTSLVLEDPADGSWNTTAAVPGQGAFAVQPDGQVVFTPAAGYEGTVASLMYRVTDANGTTRTATIHVVIGNAPVAAPDTATTLQGHPVTLPLLTNDHPGTGGTLVPGTTQLLDPADGTYKASVTIADEGTWTVDPATGAMTFTPLSTYVGHSTPITYEVTDSFGNTATSTATVTVAEVVPTASGDTATTAFRTPVTVEVLANDSPGRADTPFDPTTVQLKDPVTGHWVTTVTVASVGTWTVKADGSVTFTPVATYVGVTAPLSYQVADINGTYAGATLVVTVAAPYGAKSDSDSANGSGTDPVTLNPLANDTPSKGATWILSSVCLVLDSAKTIAGTALGSCPKTAVVAGVGTWVVNSDGTMTFTPVAGFTGTASIGYLVTDTNGVEVANTVLVTMTKLPNTGGPVVFVGVLGVLLLLAGGVVLLISRRRRGHQA